MYSFDASSMIYAWDNYHNTKGVDVNDLYIMSIAKENKKTLVSNEARQIKLPTEKRNYKIPTVCNMPEVDIKCISFLDLLKLDIS